MHKKLLQHTFLLFFILFSISNTAFGQGAIRFKTLRASERDDSTFHQQFREYTLATLNTENVTTLLRSKDYHTNLTLDVQESEFDFSLIAHDIRHPDYKLQASTESGIVEYPRSPNKTFFGYTQEGHYDVRITADEDFFNAMIVQSHDVLFIEPARDIVAGAPKNQFVIYWQSDNLKLSEQNLCQVRHLPPSEARPSEEHDAVHSDSRNRACKVVQIALADDHLMFNKYGSVNDVEDHNTAVINNVLTNYDDDFNDDLQFLVTTIFVATTVANDPFTNSTDPGDLLDSFASWAPSGFGATHDVASLWSDRDFNGSTIGLAWVDALCSSFRYNVLQDFSNNANLLRVLQAHELGHNFGADHDAAGSPYIMAPAVQNTTQWSNPSINAINSGIAGAFCFSNCSPPAPPVANFTADPTSGCAPLQVFFDDLSTNNPTSWSWSFPGGTPSTSTNQNPIVTYNTPGTYNVSLTVSNTQGSNTKTINNYITVDNEPFADFDYEADDLTVTFTNLSQFGNTYLWNFGDGFTSTQFNPVHTYDEDGTYAVKLTTTSPCGSDMVTYFITILTPPFADFGSDVVEGCDPFEVEFYNYSSPNATSFIWTFPGGIPATSTAFEPTVLYETPGTYNVSLTAINAAGNDVYTANNYITVNAVPNAVFTYSGSGLQITFNSAGSVGNFYMWNFGDGQTSTQQNPVHTYAAGGNYNVTLTVSNECGSINTQQTINVIGAPVAEFIADVEDGCPVLVVHFTNTSAGNPTSFNWTFQGGSPATSTQPNPTVTYNSPGSFDVSLTVTNTSGSNSVTYDNFIEVAPPTVSDFTFFVNGLEATFSNQSQNSTSSLWFFGDGEQSNTNNPSHIYTQDGTYTVMLISSGVCGPDTSTQQVVIQTPPQSGFSLQQTDFCIPASVTFVNESSNNATSFLWTFEGGNPATSTLEDPVVSYSTAGTYMVQLIAYSAAGSDTTTYNNFVTVGDVPNAAFLLSTEGLTVTFTNQSTEADTYVWLFDDGQSSTEESPAHTYTNFGTYEVLLLASNSCGVDTMSVIIELGTVPNAFFGYSAHNGCAPFQVQFIDQSQNTPTSWAWSFEGGDPATSNEQNPLVTYNTPGLYLVSLTVANAQGSDALVLDDLIEVSAQPDATFSHTQNENIVSLEYQGIDYDSLHWDFGDGRTDNSLNPTVEYHVSGQYVIQLIVFNTCGTDTSAIVVDILTSTSDPLLNNSHWQLRPNPFNDMLNLYGEPKQNGELFVVMRDVAGKIISSTQIQFGSGAMTKQLNTENLASGMYLVELRTDKGSTVLKAVHQE
ncbi:MAG TPA: PKD domain-containing protein [Saprospiraceae bacterium]|nr:PKD domain-containing protein [Saprospiraceae bacterium]